MSDVLTSEELEALNNINEAEQANYETCTNEQAENQAENIDPNMSWPPQVDNNPLDDDFLRVEPPSDLVEYETLSTRQDFYLYELLKQFPYLIGEAIKWGFFAEKEQAKMRALVEEAEQNGIESKAIEAVNLATSICFNLGCADAYIEQALEQFDPKINPAAYSDTAGGPIIKACSLNFGFSPKGIEFTKKELETRAYYKSRYKCVNLLCSSGNTTSVVAYENLGLVKSWIAKGLEEAQNVRAKFAYLKDNQNNAYQRKGISFN